MIDIENLPAGATHIGPLKARVTHGGALEIRFRAFKYVGDVLLCYITDNDNEYPGWSPADLVFFEVPEVTPIRDPKRLAACWNACKGISTEDLEANGVASMAQALELTKGKL